MVISYFVAGMYVKLSPNDKVCDEKQLIETKEKCEAAAKELGLVDNSADVIDKSTSPKGCSWFNGKLYFNQGSPGKANLREPICYNGKLSNTITKILFLFSMLIKFTRLRVTRVHPLPRSVLNCIRQRL